MTCPRCHGPATHAGRFQWCRDRNRCRWIVMGGGENQAQLSGKVGGSRYDGGTSKAAPGGASTPLIQGPRRTGLEFD